MDKKKSEKFTTVADVLQISSSVVADYLQYQRQQDALAHLLVFANLEVIKKVLVDSGLIEEGELDKKIKESLEGFRKEVQDDNPKMEATAGEVEVEVQSGRVDVEH